MAFLIRLPWISFYATQKLAFLGILPCSEGERKTLSCFFHPKSEFGTEFKLRQMVPCLLARKERMMQRCAAIMREPSKACQAGGATCTHLIPAPTLCHPLVKKLQNLILVQSWWGKRAVSLVQGLSQIWRRGLLLLVPADHCLSMKQLQAAPQQIQLWFCQALRCENGHLCARNSQLYCCPPAHCFSWLTFPYKEYRKVSGGEGRQSTRKACSHLASRNALGDSFIGCHLLGSKRMNQEKWPCLEVPRLVFLSTLLN